MTDKDKKEKTVDHPLEDFFDMEEGTTIVPYEEHPLANTKVEYALYDDKDKEIEELFDEVYVKAIEAYDEQAEDTTVMDPRYKARNSEVAVQFLNAALNAAKEKANLKQTKDKLEAKTSDSEGPSANGGNLHVDLNDLLQTMFDGVNPADREGPPIEIEPEDFEDAEIVAEKPKRKLKK